jgi:rhamnose transport system ATP-binding protein
MAQLAPARDVAPVCRFVDISKQFGGVYAVKSVSFDILPGEIHAILGENGAGKSTMMKLLHGVYQPDSGRIEISGEPCELVSPREAERLGIAMIPQELDLFPDLSVCENLFVGRQRPRNRLGLYDWRRMRQRARELFQLLGVDIDVRASVRSLSAANAQMVEIARALIREAKVLIMDEPTAALTQVESDRLFSIAAGLKARGVAILFISHRLEEVFAHADRLTVLRDGNWIYSGRVSDVDNQKLIQMMVGRPLEKLYYKSHREVGEPALSVSGLNRKGHFSDIQLELRRGEIVGLSGLIGSGRSELGQAISGITPAESGRIVSAGKTVVIRNARDGLRERISYLPEERRSQGLHLDYSMKWNITFGSLAKISRAGVVSLAREVASASRYKALFAIKGELDQPVGGFSGGNQQKVLMAKVLSQEPDVIILDEPTRGVDVGAKAEIYRLIDQLASEGKAVLMISSELNEILSMSDRILVMARGRIVKEFKGPDFDAEAIGAAAAGVDLTPQAGVAHV